MSQEQKALFIVFGGSGDLAYRKLYPALYRLYSKKLLKENFAVIGTARRPWTDEYYQDIVLDSIADIKKNDEEAKEFASHFRYQSHNVNDKENYRSLLQLADKLDQEYKLEGNRVFYLSVSPEFFGTIATHLRSENLISDNGFNRLVIEKPFGNNYESANELNNDVLEAFTEEQIYRIDHYLGKEMIQNLLALRFSNPLFKNIWNKDHISNFQVTLAEDIGIEDRGVYYEHSGALRDMVQNHILQIVSLLYMDEPTSYDSDLITQNKINVIKNLKRINQNNVDDKFIKGQYTTSSKHPDVLDYRSENEVASDSEVETYIAGKVESNYDKWENVPIYVRTGKRMKYKNTQIDVVFKDAETPLFNTDSQNILSIHIGPEQALSLQLNNKLVGHQFDLENINLKHSPVTKAPEDYERLFLSVLKGDKTNFVHWEEVSESWKYIDDIRLSWKKNKSELYLYPVFSNGPEEALSLLKKDYTQWFSDLNK